MYQGVAHIQMTHRSERIESGVWERKEQAADELCYLITRALPIGESFKVVQNIIKR